MKFALVITGVLAALAIAVPMLVVAGYFLLIVPGLVLTAAPTVFLYLAATAAVRRLLMKSTSIQATAAAFGVVIFLGLAVMQPFRAAALATYTAKSLPDVVPANAVELDGHVRLEFPDSRRQPDCDYLSLAVLESPRVQSVTTSTGGHGGQREPAESASYALVSADGNSPVGIFPSEPGRIVREDPLLVQKHRGRHLVMAAKAVEANWALRLSGDERLQQVEPHAADTADWIVQIEDRTTDQTSRLRRITILDATGAVRFRRSYRKQAVPARLFYLGFHVSGGAGTISNASFHVGRQVLESGDRSLNPESALLTAISRPAPRCDVQDIALLRERVEQILEGPEASRAQLELPRRFLGLFFFDTSEEDHSLIARIVADDRVTDLEQPMKNVFSKDKIPVALRDAYARRILMNHTSANMRYRLAEQLANLPRGTFADPTEEHLAIWNTPEVYREAAPFLVALADLSPERAVPALQAALDTALGVPDWNERRRLVNGICQAFVRLGPNAASAVPRIRELFLRRPSPILRTSKGADQWRFTLARMGVPIKDLPVFPNQSPRTFELICRRIADRLRQYERDHAKEIAS
ncbi:hypothetical protein [Fuerstiella marisgermanici]|nr:hypothetical protein [Fuerstiella marisgermanici]